MDRSRALNQSLLVRIGLGVLSGAVMALAVWLLTASNPDPTPSFPLKDKLQHVLMFAALTGPALLALERRYWGFWLAHMVALAAGSELVQLVENVGRQASTPDFLADALGIAGAGWIVARLKRNLTPEAGPPVPQNR